MSVSLVTGYVRLDSRHRSHARYCELGQRLLNIGIPGVAFHDRLEDLWMTRELGSVPYGSKDSLAYFCVQNQKSEWLLRASRCTDAKTLVWMDYGILHNVLVPEPGIVELFDRVAANPPDRIAYPGCHKIGDLPIPRNQVHWAFCGTILILPSDMAEWFATECRRVALAGQPTWEVNVWAIIAQANPDKFRWYAADHDASLLRYR